MDRAVVATASELFEARHYSGVVAVCSDALEGEPEHLPLLMLRARSHIALRRELDAQADLRDIIRLDPACSVAYRLLGELAARRNEHEPAVVFFREALRLNPDDREANDWLMIVEGLLRSVAGAGGKRAPAKSPAAPRLAKGTETGPMPGDERVTLPLSASRHVERPAPARPTFASKPSGEAATSTLAGRPEPQRPAKEAPRLNRRPTTRQVIDDAPGFDEYLVANGIITRERLRAAQAYQRSMKVQLSTAIVTLGLASPQRIEWAAIAHRSLVGREP